MSIKIEKWSDFPRRDELEGYFKNIISDYNIHSIELAGSYARGEQLISVYYESDIEFLVFYSGKQPDHCNIDKVDLDFIKLRNVIFLDRSFFLYDFSRNTSLVYGVNSAIRPFNFTNISAWSIDEIILWRIFSVLKAKTKSEGEYRLSLLRNIDYLLTFHLLKEGYYFDTMAMRRDNIHLLKKRLKNDVFILLEQVFRFELQVSALESCFSVLLPDEESLFRDKTMKDTLKNHYRFLANLIRGRILSRKKLIRELYIALKVGGSSLEVIERVEIYYKT